MVLVLSMMDVTRVRVDPRGARSTQKSLAQSVAVAINPHDIVNGATFLFQTEYPSAAPH
jgi:hypothetical protein